MLYKETVHPDTFQLLTELSQNRELSNFQLVGGTALSLQLGHRISTDLDLFSEKDFDTDLVRGILDKYQGVRYNQEGKNLIRGSVNNIKVDFACHKYKTIKEGIRLNNIRISSKGHL